jgi:hypothetical protein
VRAAVFPLRLPALAGVVVSVAMVTLLQTGHVFGWAPVRWTLVSALARETLFLTGPVVCAIGAWSARVNTTVVTTLAPARSWTFIVNHHLRVVAPAVMLGFTLGLAPAFARAGSRATSGGLDIMVVLSGFAGLALMLVVGYLAGAMVGAPTGIVTAGVVGFVLTGGLMVLSDALTSSGLPMSLFSVMPFWSFPLSRGSHEVWQLAAFRTVLFLGLAVATAMLAPRLLDLRFASRRTKSLVIATILSPAATLGLLALILQPAVATPDTDPPISCRDINAGSVCVYAEEDAILADAARAISETVDRFGPGALSGRFSSVKPDQQPEPLAQGDMVFTPQVHYDRAWFVEALWYDTARGISGSSECDRVLFERYGPEYYNTAPLQAREADVVAQTIAAEIAQRMGAQADGTLVLPRDEGTEDWPATRRLEEALAAKSDPELRTWLSEHADDLRSCTVRPEQLKMSGLS